VEEPLVLNETTQTITVNNIQISGLKQKDVTSIEIYCREEVKELWNQLDDCPTNAIVFVQGCPGVGKSIAVFAHTMRHCRLCNISLLYYHMDKAHTKCFVMDREGHVQHVDCNTIKELVAFIRLKRHYYDVTVIDGTHSEGNLEEIFLDFPDNKKLIVCTSYQALKLNQEASYFLISRLKRWVVASWTLDDYIGCSEAHGFPFLNNLEEQNREEIIYSRLKLCGGSVRLFSGDQDYAMNYIQTALQSVSNYNELYQNRVGDRSRDAVNSLMSLYKTDKGVNTIPLSQYVFEELSKRCGDEGQILKFISDARRALPNNPSWQGWVTEYEVVSILKLRGELVVFRQVEGTIKKGRLMCNRLTELQENEKLKRYEEYELNDWVLPYKWNQAFWDACQILENGCLGIRQITSGESHKNKFTHAKKLINEVNPKALEFLTICRASNFENFLPIDESLASIKIPVVTDVVWYQELFDEVHQTAFKKRRK
jgi:hypothetical protein